MDEKQDQDVETKEEELSEEMKETVKTMSEKSRILLSTGMMSPMDMVMFVQSMSACQKSGNNEMLAKLATHLDIGLRIVAREKAFPTENCEKCKSFDECQVIMEGVEPISQDEANQLMQANKDMPTGNA